MTITNAEILDRLQDHLLKSDAKVIARALANQLLDFHRLYIYNKLPEQEQASLMMRLQLNETEFLKFVENGPTSPFTLINTNMRTDEGGKKDATPKDN